MMPARASDATDRVSLAARLAARIAAEGPLTVEEFMEACLLDEAEGVYTSRQPIGGAGDFVTAPEISQIFGELIGLWALAAWQGMGEPERVTIAELGPGRGTLLADAMRAWRVSSSFLAAASVALVEPSRTMAETQRDTLRNAGVPLRWCTDPGEAAGGPLILIANEVIDALPVRQFVRRDGVWHERLVTSDGKNGFAFTEGPAAAIPRPNAPEGAIMEIRPAADRLLGELAHRAAKAPLAALFIDYGHEEPGFGDTLQAVRGHRFADPLAAPGKADLSAQVDFAALKQQAEALGLKTHGPMPQGEFLLKLGLGQRREQLLAHARPEQTAAVASGTARLVDPQQMGVLFKVLAVTSANLPPPPPFAPNDSTLSSPHAP